MSEISDMVLNGDFCQACGILMHDGGACGYPRYCPGCDGNPDTNYASLLKPLIHRKVFTCQTCGKKFKTLQGANDHKRDVHGSNEQFQPTEA